MKKLITILLCIFTFGILLTGCSNAESKKSSLQITLKDATVELPESWTDKYITEETDSSITVYHKNSKEHWEANGEEETGVLFSLNYSDDDSYTELPSYDDLGESENGGYYYISYPTDVQAYVLDEEIQEEYDTMYDEIEEIKESASLH